MNTISIFNNVLGPVMRGPSSSHTAASVRIGLLGRRLLGEEPVYAKFTFDPSGSLATTYRGQGSAMGLAGGLLGMEMSDNDLVRSEDISREKGLKIEYVIEDRGDTHPNTYNVLLRGTSGQEITFKALSTGGGIVSLEEINGKKVEDDSEYINSLLPLPVDKSPSMPFSDIYEIKSMVEERGGLLSDYALVWESAIGNVSEEKIMQLAVSVAGIMKDSITKGLEGTEYADRILHRQSHLLSGKPSVGQLIPADISNRIIQSVTAIMEVKSSMGLIVAGPTAGSCAALPGSLLTVAETVSKSEHEITRALLTGGRIGVFIAQKVGFAAEEGGCQYECGSASGMAAAALTELMGGDAAMSINAASMALQNSLGMICDPVADRVEVPCLGKNVMAALNALAAANMVIAGFKHVIPLDEVICAMQEVGNAMDHKYRCTCKGGLSVTGTAHKISRKLN